MSNVETPYMWNPSTTISPTFAPIGDPIKVRVKIKDIEVTTIAPHHSCSDYNEVLLKTKQAAIAAYREAHNAK